MTEAAVAILLRREREVVDAFRAAGATEPSKALSLRDLNLEQTIAVQRLQRRAVLREAPSGFYLDEPSWLALHGMRRRVVLVAVGVLIIAMLLMLFRGRLT